MTVAPRCATYELSKMRLFTAAFSSVTCRGSFHFWWFSRGGTTKIKSSQDVTVQFGAIWNLLLLVLCPKKTSHTPHCPRRCAHFVQSLSYHTHSWYKITLLYLYVMSVVSFKSMQPFSARPQDGNLGKYFSKLVFFCGLLLLKNDVIRWFSSQCFYRGSSVPVRVNSFIAGRLTLLMFLCFFFLKLFYMQQFLNQNSVIPIPAGIWAASDGLFFFLSWLTKTV